MSEALPPHPSLAWLRKTAKQQLRQQRAHHPDAKLAETQPALARKFGFSGWRALKAHIERLQHPGLSERGSPSDADAAAFLRAVGAGQLTTLRAMLTAAPQLINTIGPHPYWAVARRHYMSRSKRRAAMCSISS
jgi:hypothetical protein